MINAWCVSPRDTDKGVKSLKKKSMKNIMSQRHLLTQPFDYTYLLKNVFYCFWIVTMKYTNTVFWLGNVFIRYKVNFFKLIRHINRNFSCYSIIFTIFFFIIDLKRVLLYYSSRRRKIARMNFDARELIYWTKWTDVVIGSCWSINI